MVIVNKIKKFNDIFDNNIFINLSLNFCNQTKNILDFLNYNNKKIQLILKVHWVFFIYSKCPKQFKKIIKQTFTIFTTKVSIIIKQFTYNQELE